jgi:lipoprotein NlpI
LDPKNPGIYDNRGAAKAHEGDLSGAISDYDRALNLNPKLAGVYLDRGNAKDLKGDHNAAIADYNRALGLDPKLAGAYLGRGAAEMLNGDAAPAIADCNRALQLNPKLAVAYENRAYANFLARNWTGALRDCRRFCELSDRHQEDVRLCIWLVRSRLGERSAADKELAADFHAEPQSRPSKIRAYLLGKLSESEFLAAASSDLKDGSRQRLEAWFYAGMKNLLDGNKSEATEFFKKCVAAGQRGTGDYALAKAELIALRQ